MKRLVYLLIPIMVMLVACCNKPTIDFTDQEAVCKAWSEWDNQNAANKDALVKNAIEKINGKNAERAACQAKKDSVAAIMDAKWSEVEASTDVEAQKALIDEIYAICKENCGKCCKDGEKKCCKKDGEKKECDKKDGEKKECCKEKAECCQAWADWANLKSDKKAELVHAVIEKHNACKAKCEEKKAECATKKAECATKKAEFDAKWATISTLDIEAQKALIDEVFAACPSKCCKDGEKKCCKEKAEETKE